MEIELTKGSSRVSGSQVDDLESVGSRRNLERTAGWANWVAQHSVPSRPLSPNVVIEPPENVTQDRGDKRFSSYPNTTPLFQPGAGLFSAQLQDSSILKKPEIPKSITVTEPHTFLPKTTFQQQGPSAFQNRQTSQSPKHNSRSRSMESQKQSTVSQAIPQVIYQPSGDPRGLREIGTKLTEFSRDPLEWPEWADLLDVIVHQKRRSDTEKMQYLMISFTGRAKAAISGLGFNSKSYYQACNILCKNFGRPRVIAESQLKKTYTHTPVRHDDSSSIFRFSNIVTYRVNVLTRFGFQHDLELGRVLSSATSKLSSQFKEQWVRHLQDHRPLAAISIVFKEWLESTASILEDLLAQTNPKLQNGEKQQTNTFASNVDDSMYVQNRQHAIWSCQKFKSRKLNERREHVQKFRLCFIFLRRGHRSNKGLQKQNLQRAQMWTTTKFCATNFSTLTSQRRRLQQVPQMLRQQ